RAGPLFWEAVRDKSALGIDIHLMHETGRKCMAPKTVKNFDVMHHNDNYTQLLRHRLWPATNTDPTTATTFSSLDQFSRLAMLGRLTGYDYYQAMCAATDAMGILKLPSLLKQFMRSARQFRHVHMYKRAGRAHDAGGIAGTPAGGAAIECPACPRPGWNIPDSWISSPLEWLYRRYLAIDANFRLSNRFSRSTEKSDPCLNDGRAYVVAAAEFEAYLKEVDKDKDGNDVEQPVSCSRFNAITEVNQKGGRGLRTTGVAGCFCARHDFWMPCGCGWLTKGERYSVIDYIVCRVHSWIGVRMVVYSYDISCQWSVNFAHRLRNINPAFSVLFDAAQGVLDKTRTFLVPKFHLYAHKFWCFCRYNFSYTPGVAQTDGEGCERVWSGMNGGQGSIRESGVGAWRDMMDDMCQAWNHKKACALGSTLTKNMKEALQQAYMHCDIYTDLTTVIKTDALDKYVEYSGKLEKWDAAGQKGKDCPYEHTLPDVSLPELTRRAETEVDLVAAPKTAPREISELVSPNVDASCSAAQNLAQDGGSCNQAAADGDVTSDENAKVREVEDRRLRAERERLRQDLADVEENEERVKWLMLGMKIEDDRQRLKSDAADDSPDVKASREDALFEALVSFRAQQDRFMPGFLATLPTEVRDPREEDSHKTPLCMPSGVSASWRTRFGALTVWESRVRLANMDAALDELRRTLRLRVALNKFKIANWTGQTKNTRARSAQSAVDKRVRAAASAYRRHRDAYAALRGWQESRKPVSERNDVEAKRWEKRWQVLKPEHVKGLGDKTISTWLEKGWGKAKEFLEKRNSEKKAKKYWGVKQTSNSGLTKSPVSWIWYNVSEDDDGLDVTDGAYVRALERAALI
ncbi:unnamed protein product, partial [Peniophora sp. CBMAI 1063]